MSTPLAAVDYGGAVTDGFRSFATFVPRLVGFLVVLLVGYVLAKAVQKVLTLVLERVGFDRAVERGGVKKALAGSRYDAAALVALLGFWVIFLTAISIAVGVLGILALQAPITALIVLLPKIIVAVVLVVIGAVAAGAVKRIVEGALGGLSYGRALSAAASGLVLLLFVKAALDEVGVASAVTGPVLYTLLATAGGVVVVGAGGGLVRPMQSRWEQWLTRAEVESSHVRAARAADTPPPVAAAATAPAPGRPVGAPIPDGPAAPGASPASSSTTTTPTPLGPTAGSTRIAPEDPTTTFRTGGPR